MSVSLRLRRMGRKQHPVFGLVAADSRSPRDGRFIEDLGRYEPVSEPAVVKIDAERVIYWLSQGAQPSDTVHNLLQREGILYRWALTRKGEEAEAIEAAIAEFKERQSQKVASKGKKTNAERREEALQAERAAAKEKAAELAKARAEREAELRAEREKAEAAARAEAEEARAQAAADAADSEALTTAADETTAAGDDSQPEAEAAATTEETPAEAPADEAADAQAEAQSVDEAEAEGAAAAVAETTEETVAEEAPDAAEEQPAVEDATPEAVADDAGEAVADQTDAATEAPAEETTEAATEEAPVEEVHATVEESETAAEEVPGDTASDDLTAISGIGPKYSEILTNAGITTFAALAETSVERLQEVIHEAGSPTAGNEETWAEQARALLDGGEA